MFALGKVNRTDNLYSSVKIKLKPSEYRRESVDQLCESEALLALQKLVLQIRTPLAQPNHDRDLISAAIEGCTAQGKHT